MLKGVDKKGFTIVELLIVIGIIGVLLSVVLIVLRGGKSSNLPEKSYYEKMIEQSAESCPNGLDKFEYKSGNPIFTCK